VSNRPISFAALLASLALPAALWLAPVLAADRPAAQGQAGARPASDRSATDPAGDRSAAGRLNAAPPPWADLGRPATPAELAAWDIDVRADFTGLPAGSGSVDKGMEVWDGKCASCHGTFGESNEVFMPLVGGTTAQDIENGQVANLKRSDFPQRTTLMKLSKVSTLWDYINRAMPWNAPKSLTVEEVYAVTAYILNLGDIVPSDFVLSDKNIAEVQKLLPNRDGVAFFEPLWRVDGTPDTQGDVCMADCRVPEHEAMLPAFARDAHGNLAAQNRVVGPVRGADTTGPALESRARVATVLAAARATVTAGSARGAAVSQPDLAERESATAERGADRPAAALAASANCTSCHGRDSAMVGPSFRAIADRYRDEPGASTILADRVRRGTQGGWGGVPMPANVSVADADLRQILAWILDGAP
jgi:cytochrome c551/c552